MTAGVQSLIGWWNAAPLQEKPLDVFLLRLAAVLAAIMVTLTGVISIDAVRKWWVTLRAPATAPVPVKVEAE